MQLDPILSLYAYHQKECVSVCEPVWPSDRALGWKAQGLQFDSALALLSLQKLWSVDTVLWFCPFANRHNIYLSFTPSRSIDRFIMILITKPQPVSLCVFLCLGLSLSYLCMFVFLIFQPICLSLSSLHLYDKKTSFRNLINWSDKKLMC